METIDIQIKSNAPEVITETKSLKQQVKDLRKELEACEVGSDEYADALRRLANATHDLKDQQEAIRNSSGDLGTALANLQGVSAGVVAGFSSINAITTLVGGSNEDLQKTMVKLQAGMALVQGMKGLEGMGKKFKALVTSVKSMITTTHAQTAANQGLAASEVTVTVATKATSVALKGLKAALISTGIGAIVVLVGELINGLSKLVDWIGSSIKKDSEFKDINDKLTKTFEEENRVQDNEIKIMEASGATTEQVIQKKIDLQKAQIAETKATIDNIIARNKQIEADKKWWKIFSNIGRNHQIEQNNEELEALNEMVEKMTKNLESLEADYSAAVITTQRKAKEAGRKAADDAKKRFEEYNKLLKQTTVNAEKAFDDILKAYQKTLKNIYTATKNIDTAELWVSVFDTNPSLLTQQLRGVGDAVTRYAVDSIRDSFYEQIKGLTQDKILETAAKKLGKETTQVTQAEFDVVWEDMKKAIAQGSYDTLQSFYNEVSKVLPEFANLLPTFDDFFSGQYDLWPEITTTFTALAATARDTADTFTEQFNSLTALYDDGIIKYQEYYDSILSIQKIYTDKSAELLAQGTAQLQSDLEKNIITQEQYNERMAELQYSYSLKPREFQEKVNQAILSNYTLLSAAVESETNKTLNKIDADLATFEANYVTIWQQFTTMKHSYWIAEREAIDAQDEAERLAHEAKVQRLNELLSAEGITKEQEMMLKQELADEEVRYTGIVAEQTQKRNELKQSEIDYALDVADQSFSAMEQLFSGLNALSKARVDELDNLLAEEKIDQKEYNKLKDEELDKQAAMQKGMAIMQTAAGITTAWATAMQLGPIAGPIMAGIETAALIVNLVAQIKSINAARDASKSKGESSNPTPPDTSFTLQSTDAYQTTLSDETQSDLQANAQQNQRVYVVSSDISDAQNNEKTTVTTATF